MRKEHIQSLFERDGHPRPDTVQVLIPLDNHESQSIPSFPILHNPSFCFVSVSPIIVVITLSQLSHNNVIILQQYIMLDGILRILMGNSKTIQIQYINQRVTQMAYLTQLFEKIAQDVGKPYKDFEGFIRVLEENWYDTEEAIRQITDEQFDSMKIPKRIATKIKEHSGGTPKDKPEARGMVRDQNQSNHLYSPQPRQEQETQDFNKLYKEQTAVQNVVKQFVGSLQRQTTSNKTKIQDSIKLLMKIVENIILQPNNQKFKVIKLSSNTLKNYILCYDSCVYLIDYIGFVRTADEIMMLEPDIGHLKSVRRNLELELDIVNNMHDPYQASFNSSNMMPNMINEDKDDKNYNEMLDQLIQYRKERMSHPPSDRKVRIYHKKYQVKQAEVNYVTLEEEFLTSNDPILKQYYQKLSSTNAASSTFKNKRKIEFQLLSKQAIYQSTLVKIRLPNEYILEGVFGPYQTIEKVIQFANQYLDGNIYIYTTPPVVQMSKHKDKSLMEMDSVPTGKFFLGVEGPWQVKPEYVQFIQS